MMQSTPLKMTIPESAGLKSGMRGSKPDQNVFANLLS